MKNKFHKIFIIMFVLFLLINSGCSIDNQFEENCLNLLDIFTNTAQLSVASEVKNDVGADGNVDSTIGVLDISKSKKYLDSKKDEIAKNYKIIKSFFDQQSEKSNDALLVLAFVNDMLYRYSKQPIEDPCNYFRIIKENENIKMSSWIKDEFFGRFIFNRNTADSWNKIDEKKKHSMIYKLLLIPGGSAENC